MCGAIQLRRVVAPAIITLALEAGVVARSMRTRRFEATGYGGESSASEAPPANSGDPPASLPESPVSVRPRGPSPEAVQKRGIWSS